MNIDKQNKFGETALHICSGQNKSLELAKLLIMKGANPNIKNTIGDSPNSKYKMTITYVRSGKTVWKS